MSAMRALDLRTIGREVGIGLISVLVILYAVNYMTGQQEQSAFAFEITATEEVAADAIVVYGVTCDKATAKPVRGAKITLARALGDGRYEQVGAATSAADGTFRIEVPGAPAGEYRLLAEAIVGTGTARSAFHLDAAPGNAYGFSIELIEKEYFVLLPLPGY